MMKGPRELKRYIAKNKKRFQKKFKNGVLPVWFWDNLRIFKLEDNCKKWYSRKKKHKKK